MVTAKALVQQVPGSIPGQYMKFLHYLFIIKITLKPNITLTTDNQQVAYLVMLAKWLGHDQKTAGSNPASYQSQPHPCHTRMVQ